MKKTWLFLLLIYSISVTAQSGPSLLKSPANWQFEQFSLPPEFAPSVRYHGHEELRFSPGWDKKEAADYFTIIWGFRFDDTKGVSQADIKQFLLTYFKGLCGNTAKARHLSQVDTSAISVAIQKKPATDKSSIYDLTLHLFGVFADGAPITVNAEIKAVEDGAHKRVYLLMIASLKDKADPVWKQLYKEQREFASMVPF